MSLKITRSSEKSLSVAPVVKAVKGGNQYLCLNENVPLLRQLVNSMVLVRHHWLDRQAALWKIAMKMCGLQQDFVT